MKLYALHSFHELVDTRDDSPYYSEGYELWNTLRNADQIHSFKPTPETHAYRLSVIREAGYDAWSDHTHGAVFYEDFSDDFWIDARQEGIVDWDDLTMYMGHESVFRYSRLTFPRLNLIRKSLEVGDIIGTLNGKGDTLTEEEYAEITDMLFNSLILIHQKDEENKTDLFFNIQLYPSATSFLTENIHRVESVPGLAAKLLIVFCNKRSYPPEDSEWFQRYVAMCSEENIIFILSRTIEKSRHDLWFLSLKEKYISLTGYPEEWVDALMESELTESKVLS